MILLRDAKKKAGERTVVLLCCWCCCHWFSQILQLPSASYKHGRCAHHHALSCFPRCVWLAWRGDGAGGQPHMYASGIRESGIVMIGARFSALLFLPTRFHIFFVRFFLLPVQYHMLLFFSTSMLAEPCCRYQSVHKYRSDVRIQR